MKTCCSGVAALAAAVVLAAPVYADAIDDTIQAFMVRENIPGLSLAVLRDGKIVKSRGYGFANLEWKIPADSNTVYQIGSVTKQFTATAIMMLVEEGKIGLDDPLEKYLAEMPDAWKPVTIRQLLTHTSGIPSYTANPEFGKTLRKDFTPSELLALVKDKPMDFAPGVKWSYNNTGYFLLGLILEKVSGKTYGGFLEERIFKPLQMTATRVNDLRAIVLHRATGYDPSPTGLVNGEYVSPTQPFAAGALLSSTNDLAKWTQAQGSDKLLKAGSWQEMWKPVTLTDGKTAPYGFGWGLGNVQGQPALEHGGGIPGFTTYLTRFPKANVAVIVLCNTITNPQAIANAVAFHLLAPKDGRKVTFTLHNQPSARNVSIAGGFNGWSPMPMQRKGNDWTTTLKLSRGTHAYKFVVDNQWITDPANKETVKDGEHTNSVLTVP